MPSAPAVYNLALRIKHIQYCPELVKNGYNICLAYGETIYHKLAKIVETYALLLANCSDYIQCLAFLWINAHHSFFVTEYCIKLKY